MTQKQINNVPTLRFSQFNDEWKTLEIQKIADSTKKWSFTGGPFGSDLKAEDYTESGVRILQLQNIGDGMFNDDYKIYTSESKADELVSSNIFPGEILLSKMGDPVARACIVPNTDKRFLMASDGIRLLVDKQLADNYFIFLIINQPSFRKRAIQLSTGSTRRRIGLSELRTIYITIPSLDEQQKIAGFLTFVDEKITTLQKKIELLKKYKKGIIQQVFTQKIRFKDEKGNDFPDWEEKNLGSISEIVGGGTPDTLNIDFWNGEIKWLTPTEVKTKYISKSEKKISKLGLKHSSAKLLPPGTVIFTSRATIGEVGISKVELTTNQGFQSIVVNAKSINEFIYYWITFNKNTFLRKANGSTFLEISKQEMQKIKINLPSKKEQQKIANLLSAIDDSISLEEKKWEQAKKFKKSLLQQMFV